MKKIFDLLTKGKVDSPKHYASKYILDRNPYGDSEYHSFSTSKEAEDDYQQIINKKYKINSYLEITSKSLKLEYTRKLEYLKKNLILIFILSSLIILNALFNLKLFGFSELNISTIILSSISITITIILLFNIRTNVLLDLYGFSSFYLFSIFESCILIILYILKIINLISTIQLIYKNNKCKGKNKQKSFFCWNNSSYFILIFLNLIIFVGVFMLIKYTLISFYEAFNILILKQKTTVQKQLEINEKGFKHGDKIEFEDDDKNNESSNRIINDTEKLDTFDNLKTE